MSLQFALQETTKLDLSSFERFTKLIDPAWIEQALAMTGTVSIRRRRLPADRIVWLVVGLALFKNQPIWLIVQQLGLACGEGLVPSSSGAVQARQRLGELPLAALFKQLAEAWVGREQPADAGFLGLRSFAVDGVVWSTPDTPENREAFGCGRSHSGDGAWPQVRGVCLMDTYSHLVRAACFGEFAVGELSHAKGLEKSVSDHSVTIFDRAYYSAALLLDWQHSGTERHWLMRARKQLSYVVVEELGPGDCLVRLTVSHKARKQRPDLPEYWHARLIEYSIDDKPRRYLISLTDAKRYPANEVAGHYNERWEIELVAPQRLSFLWLAQAISNALRYCPTETPGTIPKRLAELRMQAKHFMLPARRKRSYPRVVKPRPVKYPKKKGNEA